MADIHTRIPLAFLAQKVQATIIDGCQPSEVSIAQLIRDGIPMDWSEQAGSSASPDPEFGRTHGKRAGFKAESQENDLMKLIFPVYSLYLPRGKTERGALRAETRGAMEEIWEA